MRVSVIHRLSVVSVAAAALTVSANASAQHPHAIVWRTHISGGLADQAGAVSMMMSHLESDCNNFVDHEMWYGVEGTGTNNVEVGFTNGQDDGGCIFTSAFWADTRN